MSDKECTCKCGSENKSDFKTPPDIISFIYEKTIKKLIILLIIAIVLIFATNGIWLYAFSQFNFESYEVKADGESNANYIGQNGDIYNGGFNKSPQDGIEE